MRSSGAQISPPKERGEDFFLISGSSEQRKCAKEHIAKKLVSQETLNAYSSIFCPDVSLHHAEQNGVKCFVFQSKPEFSMNFQIGEN